MRQPSRGAFTLFEVMISLLVLTTAILATVALLPVGLKAQQLARSQMFAASAAMTLINNFHTPVDKFQGISRLAPHYDGQVGVDATSTSQAPYTGWAGVMEQEEIQASPYQPNLEQQQGWLTGVLPVPTVIAQRLDSDHDEIGHLIAQGGVLLYPDPNFMMGLNQGASQDKTLQIAPTSELQKLVFAVTSLPQQNALTSNPSISQPWYELYPFGPSFLEMRAFGRETRRLWGCGGGSGSGNYFYPNYFNAGWGWPIWFSGGGAFAGRGGWWGGFENGGVGGKWTDFKRSGVTMAGNSSGNWYISRGIVGFDDGGHGRYEPVVFEVPSRQGQEQGDYFPNSPLDDPDYNGDDTNPDVLNTGTADHVGNGFYQGRNWRFFATKLPPGNMWDKGSDPAAAAGTAYLAFQRLAGVDDPYLTVPRSNYTNCSVKNSRFIDPVRDPNQSKVLLVEPMDSSNTIAKNYRSGWLPVQAMIKNPDSPSYEGMQNMDWNELFASGWAPSQLGPQDWYGSIYGDLITGDNLKNLTWKTAPPRTVSLMATYEMRANYRDRAIDLWQAVMPRNTAGLYTMSKFANVNNDEGGTLVDCTKYEFPATELDQFVMLRPDQLDPRDRPIHPAQVLALSYLAHAAMMVTGYGPPFGEVQQGQDVPGSAPWAPLDVVKIPWECLNWTYLMTPQELNYLGGNPNVEVSLWSSVRTNGNGDPPGQPVSVSSPLQPLDNVNSLQRGTWEYPFDWNQFHWSPPDQWDNNYQQQYPISQNVPGQGITKDAMMVAADATPGSTTVTLVNDTAHPWNVYPGDELVFQISYYQWWYKWGKPWYGGNIYGQGDSYPQWDGRYDDQHYPSDTNQTPGPFYPNFNYKLETFRVTAVNGSNTPQGEVPGPTTLTVTITPPLPYYPIQFNDARHNPPVGDMDPVSVHKNTLVRRVCSASDRIFARKVYEMAVQWAAAYAAESPNDCGAPRPANRQIMMDKPLALFDLFYDAVDNGSNGSAIRQPHYPPTDDGTSAAMQQRRNESFYRWMVPTNPVPDSWFHGVAPPQTRRATTNLGPGRERSSFFEQMVYNDQLQPPTPTNDDDRFWLTKPFAAFHRARQLTFWSVDWKAYEDAETVPCAPADFAKHDRYLRHSTLLNTYDVIAPYVEYGHSPLCGLPESLYVWVSPQREKRYVDIVGGDSAGYLYQNWIGAPDQLRSGTFTTLDPTNDAALYPNAPSLIYPVTADPPSTDNQTISADVHLGHWGADRNGNGVLDVGPVPAGARMRAVHVADFVYYDPVLRVHYGN
jgi:hypothetical protein